MRLRPSHLWPDAWLLAVDEAFRVADDEHALLGPGQQHVGAVLQPHKPDLIVPAAQEGTGRGRGRHSRRQSAGVEKVQSQGEQDCC